MPDYHFERECRTAHSECYVIEADDNEVGRVDIHYATSVAYATLCVPESLSEDDIQDLITEIDERLVMSNDPYREDFIVTVWAGRETGVYSEEETFEEDEEEEAEEEEAEGNGHKD
jgi:hypothetical protein